MSDFIFGKPAIEWWNMLVAYSADPPKDAKWPMMPQDIGAVAWADAELIWLRTEVTVLKQLAIDLQTALDKVDMENIALRARIKELEEVLEDKRRLTRELDVAMHGEEGAAKQASLCDLIGSAGRLRRRAGKEGER